MNNTKILCSIFVMAIVTALIRFLPFIIFGKKKTPAFIEYLGKVLPSAVMGMLAVYCLKEIRFDEMVSWVPGIVGVVSTVIVQAWKRNPIYSILTGTVIYMILLRVI